MKLFSLFLICVLAVMSVSSCSKAPTERGTSPAGALTANSALNLSRPFGKHHLNPLPEFMLPEVRARLDEEPIGDADSGYDPSAIDPAAPSEQAPVESAGEAQPEEPQASNGDGEDGNPISSRLDTTKFSWAKKSFGDAVKADPAASGVIVLYADENYYDLVRLTSFVEQGRDRIAQQSAIGGERIQVVFGGYRSAPQVEMWVIPQGGPMPEFKPEDRPRKSEREN